MIIWIASYPRSGNTFACQLIEEIYGAEPHSLYPYQDLTLGAPARPEIIQPLDKRLPFGEMVKSDQVYFVKTHDLPADDFPAIYLVRDGRDALVSHAHFVLDYDLQIPLEEQSARYLEILQALIEKEDWFGGWGPNVLAWTSRSAPTAVVKFEELIESPLDSLQRSLDALGYKPQIMKSISIPTFDELHRAFPRFFRRGQVGAWRAEMTGNLHELFWLRYGAAMRQLGYIDDDPLERFVTESSELNQTYRVAHAEIMRLTALLAASEADRQARFEVINDLKEHLDASETDRQARLDVINDLKQHLAASEADRKARLDVINELKQHLDASEADRKAQRLLINGLLQQLSASEAARMEQHKIIDQLKHPLDADLADRAAQS